MGPVNQRTLFGSQQKAMNQWQKEEKEKFKRLLSEYGKNWGRIAQGLPKRNQQQCRNYYQNYKTKYQLDRYLP